MFLFKRIKNFVGIALFSISLNSIAQPPTQAFAIKTEGQVTASQQKLIMDSLQYINDIWVNPTAASRQLTEKYFTPDTALVINSKNAYTGYRQLESHFQQVGKNIHGKFQFPLLEVIGTNNKIVARFDEDIVDNQGIHYPANVIAIFTLQNDKIQLWEEVANTKYFCQAASANIVFSKQ